MNKKARQTKKAFSLLEVVIIMILTCLVSIFIGSVVTFISIKTNTHTETKTVETNIKLKDFEDTYNNILDNYYYQINEDELLEAAIDGMVDYLNDPYSKIIDSEDAISFVENIKGEYIGVGCEFKKENNNLVVTKIIKGSPAEIEGLKLGDIVLEIDNNDIHNKTMTELSNMLTGKINSSISLKIKRDGEEKIINITRKKIDVPSVESSIEISSNKRIGVLKINIFAANTYKQFKKELKSIETEGIDALVIDVRDNSGGYLSSASNIASLFLKKNKIIYQLKSKEDKKPILDETKEERDYPISVLINKDTASAAEVLALSLKESYGATLVGTNTYGKSKIQIAKQLTSGSVLKYTVEEWISPSGKSVDGAGITPDIEEENINEQLNIAIKALN